MMVTAEKEAGAAASPPCLAIVPFQVNSPFHDRLKADDRMFSLCGRDLRIQQRWKDDGKGGTKLGFGASVYDASFALADYLEHKAAGLVRGKRFLELGAGLGLPSIVAHFLGATSVVATDGDDELLPLIKSNAERNGATSVAVRLLTWGSRDHERDALEAASSLSARKRRDEVGDEGAPDSFDLIVGADIVACPYAEAIPGLVATLDHLAPRATPPGHPVAVLAYQARHRSEEAFFALAQRCFALRAVPRDDLHADLRHTSAVSIVVLSRLPHRSHGSVAISDVATVGAAAASVAAGAEVEAGETRGVVGFREAKGSERTTS